MAKEKLQNIKYQDIMTSFNEIDNFLFLVDTFIYLKFFNLLRDCDIRNEIYQINSIVTCLRKHF